jgi:hypothetical protein
MRNPSCVRKRVALPAPRVLPCTTKIRNLSPDFRAMRSALDTLKLERLYVVHAGRDAFPLAERGYSLARANQLAAVDAAVVRAPTG